MEDEYDNYDEFDNYNDYEPRPRRLIRKKSTNIFVIFIIFIIIASIVYIIYFKKDKEPIPTTSTEKTDFWRECTTGDNYRKCAEVLDDPNIRDKIKVKVGPNLYDIDYSRRDNLCNSCGGNYGANIVIDKEDDGNYEKIHPTNVCRDDFNNVKGTISSKRDKVAICSISYGSNRKESDNKFLLALVIITIIIIICIIIYYNIKK